MAYLEVSAFKKIRAFFWALQKSGFNLNKIPTRDNEGTPVDKAYCLNLLRSFPDFQGEEFKDDNFLTKYLSKPGNLKQILDQFTPAQQIELMKALEEKPIVVETVSEQPSGGETSAEQGVSAQTPVGTATNTMGVPGLPSAPVIHNVPRVNRPERPPQVKTYPKPPVVETGLDYEGKPYATEKPSAGQTGRRFQAPKIPYAVNNAAKNFGSAAQRFIGTNLGRIGRGLGGMLGGGIGVGGRALGRAGLGAVDFGARFSSAISTRGSAFTAADRGGARFAMVGLFGFVLLAGLLTAFAPNPSPGQATPAVGGPSYIGGGAGIVSCPLNDGRITCGSQNAGGSCNHCAANYTPYTCPAGENTGRETAIDVVSSDRLIFLPFIGGSSVQWTIDEANTPVPVSEGGGGIAIAATATTGGKTYRIRFVHIASTNLKVNDQVPSGTLIGQYISTASHVHITIQEDGTFKPADTYFKLCTK